MHGMHGRAGLGPCGFGRRFEHGFEGRGPLGRGRGLGAFRIPVEERIRSLEEYQRDLEQELADVGDELQRLRQKPAAGQ